VVVRKQFIVIYRTIAEVVSDLATKAVVQPDLIRKQKTLPRALSGPQPEGPANYELQAR
jgi:hypothetical protein